MSFTLNFGTSARRDKLAEYIVCFIYECNVCVFYLYYEKTEESKLCTVQWCVTVFFKRSVLVLAIDLILFTRLVRWTMQYVSA